MGREILKTWIVVPNCNSSGWYEPWRLYVSTLFGGPGAGEWCVV